LKRSRESARTHELTLATLRRLLRMPAGERAGEYNRLYWELSALRDCPFEQKTLAYLDVGAWLRLHVATPVPV
ncbi:MAG: hypothetical protein AAFZ52_00360, partial [Bacteroidota bacterium]